MKEDRAPHLGLATTRELLEEVETRMRVTQNSDNGRKLGALAAEALERLDPHVLNYRIAGETYVIGLFSDDVLDLFVDAFNRGGRDPEGRRLTLVMHEAGTATLGATHDPDGTPRPQLRQVSFSIMVSGESA